jgi:arylsulfatase A-like enzyme
MMPKFPSILIAATILFASCAHHHGHHADTFPNIILLVADDLGYGDVHCYGNPLIETPHIDALASSGTRFTNGYAAAPLCSPTRAAIITGLSPARLHMTEHIHGLHPTPSWHKWITPHTRQGLDSSLYTLPKMLKSYGYSTAHIGKWHLGDGPSDPLSCGFDHRYGGSWAGLPNSFFYPFFNNNAYPELIADAKEGDWIDDILTNHAMSWIGSHSTKPFFLSLNFYAPHVPIQGKPSLIKKYSQKLKDSNIKRNINPVYAAMVHSIDDNVGRLIKFLSDKNLRNNTLIIFTSDNGALSVEEVKAFAMHTPPTDNLPFSNGKGYISEGGIRVPFIISWPKKIKPNIIDPRPIISTDIMPTCAYLVHEKLSLTDGHNILTPDTTSSLHFWYFPHYSPQRGTPAAAIRSQNFKLIIDYHTSDTLLYNLHTDPSESIDLASSFPALTSKLSHTLQQWLIYTKSQPILPNPNYIANTKY